MTLKQLIEKHEREGKTAEQWLREKHRQMQTLTNEVSELVDVFPGASEFQTAMKHAMDQTQQFEKYIDAYRELMRDETIMAMEKTQPGHRR